MRPTVRQVMSPHELEWLEHDEPLSEGLAKMARRGVGTMPVRTGGGGRPCGLMLRVHGERLQGKGAGPALTVADATSPWHAISADSSLDEAMAALEAEGLGRLPVVENGHVVGGITRSLIREYRRREQDLGGPAVMERLAHVPRPPAELAGLVGHGSFELLGLEQLVQLRREVDLKATDSVLDIGCGVGRTAIPLLAYVTDGRYEGFDPHRESIEWCRREITTRYPSFGFTHLDIRNAAYNPAGAIAPVELVFPYPDDHFDLVVLYSVFTHLLPADLDRYLSEIRRVLRPSGRMLATYFLLNQDSRRRLAELERPDAQLLLAGDGPWASRFEPAEWMVAYDEEFARARLAAAGLPAQRISYGEWISSRASAW